MNKILFYVLGVLSVAVSCSFCKIKNSIATTGQQGIEGYIYFISGNQMPSPHKKRTPSKGIKTTLYIYQLTNINQVTRQEQSAFYSSVNTKLIAKTESDSSGYFKVQLPPGRYSLFTKKGALFYSNIFDKENNITPAEVLAGKLTRVAINIDYDATY
jgi:hypothetical protein